MVIFHQFYFMVKEKRINVKVMFKSTTIFSFQMYVFTGQSAITALKCFGCCPQMKWPAMTKRGKKSRLRNALLSLCFCKNTDHE